MKNHQNLSIGVKKSQKNFFCQENLKWFLLIFITIIILLITIFININNTKDDATIITGTIETDNGNQKIDWGRYPTHNITLSESLTITEAGTYHLIGELEDGLITVNIENTVARLILDNVKIKNSSGPAILCSAGEDLVIELVGENTLEDGVLYAADYAEDVTGVVYSKADLSFSGNGNLNITANHQDAIISKDDLKFSSGNYIINAIDDGIRGKDSVYIVAGNFDIKSGGDAIKSTNETDAKKGFIVIENGKFNIDSSMKGIAAVNSILIYNGDFNILSSDDSIHSNNYVGIINGSLNLNSGDDGIHADRELIIDGGNIVVEKAYEGLESQAITINNGAISLYTSDDGINAGGGADLSSNNKMDIFSADENCVININGGNLYIDSSGDGIDSNGFLYFNGGTTVIDGPTNNGNGALDAGLGITTNGGEVIAVGASGMAEDLGSSSSIYSISSFFQNTQKAGTKIEIKDSYNNILISHISAKTFSHLAAGSDSFIPGMSYKIFIDDKEYTSFSIKDTVTIIGNVRSNQMMPQAQQNHR
ncbi:carbohydrate-binding domain-containing protein [Candidatus Saccharibacteria bacterium]|nr:carbohydrate-binding domain-containing protein [Candidatus Saccharibacteria bacterium]